MQQPMYEPNGSNYHDHRCTCPGCNYDGPEPTDAEVREWEAVMQDAKLWAESLEMNERDTVSMFAESQWQEPIRIPYDEQDCIEHTEGRPFCGRLGCPCHEDRENINVLNDLIERGLLTKDEAALIMRGATI